jgi:hypothetical protein
LSGDVVLLWRQLLPPLIVGFVFVFGQTRTLRSDSQGRRYSQ